MATADELKLRKGDILRIGKQNYKELSPDDVFSSICGTRWFCNLEGFEVGKGPKVRIVNRKRRKGTLVEYLECWVNGPKIKWKNETGWLDNLYIGFGELQNRGTHY